MLKQLKHKLVSLLSLEGYHCRVLMPTLPLEKSKGKDLPELGINTAEAKQQNRTEQSNQTKTPRKQNRAAKQSTPTKSSRPEHSLAPV